MRRNFLNLFAPPSAETLMVRSLEETKRQLVEASASREYWAAHEDMLRRRIDRLSTELANVRAERAL